MINWISKHKFQAHLTAFLLMVFSSLGMLLLIQQENSSITWLLIAIFAMSNILAIFIK